MSIIWHMCDGTVNESHIGLVMGDRFSTEDKIMSDVWDTVTKVPVWNPGMKRRENVVIGSYEIPDPKINHVLVTVDCPQDIIDAWEAQVAAEKKSAAEAGLKADARIWLHTVKTGRRVRVMSGRKVPIGTEGVVEWCGPSNFGLRAHIRDDGGATHWVSLSNVAVLWPGFKHLAGDPVAMKDAIQTADMAASMVTITQMIKNTPLKPQIGETYRSKKSGITGKIFWIKPDISRVGLRVGPGKDDVEWLNLYEIEINVQHHPVNVQMVQAFPEPFNTIHTIFHRPDGKWEARDSRDHLIAIIPASEALRMKAP